jgi:hypothetical protein
LALLAIGDIVVKLFFASWTNLGFKDNLAAGLLLVKAGEIGDSDGGDSGGILTDKPR